MILSFITDDRALAVEAERAGIDRIMIDLEREGKAQRQAGRNLFQSSRRLNMTSNFTRARTNSRLEVHRKL